MSRVYVINPLYVDEMLDSPRGGVPLYGDGGLIEDAQDYFLVFPAITRSTVSRGMWSLSTFVTVEGEVRRTESGELDRPEPSKGTPGVIYVTELTVFRNNGANHPYVNLGMILERIVENLDTITSRYLRVSRLLDESEQSEFERFVKFVKDYYGEYKGGKDPYNRLVPTELNLTYLRPNVGLASEMWYFLSSLSWKPLGGAAYLDSKIYKKYFSRPYRVEFKDFAEMVRWVRGRVEAYLGVVGERVFSEMASVATEEATIKFANSPSTSICLGEKHGSGLKVGLRPSRGIPKKYRELLRDHLLSLFTCILDPISGSESRSPLDVRYFSKEGDRRSLSMAIERGGDEVRYVVVPIPMPLKEEGYSNGTGGFFLLTFPIYLVKDFRVDSLSLGVGPKPGKARRFRSFGSPISVEIPKPKEPAVFLKNKFIVKSDKDSSGRSFVVYQKMDASEGGLVRFRTSFPEIGDGELEVMRLYFQAVSSLGLRGYWGGEGKGDHLFRGHPAVDSFSMSLAHTPGRVMAFTGLCLPTGGGKRVPLDFKPAPVGDVLLDREVASRYLRSVLGYFFYSTQVQECHNLIFWCVAKRHLCQDFLVVSVHVR